MSDMYWYKYSHGFRNSTKASNEFLLAAITTDARSKIRSSYSERWKI